MEGAEEIADSAEGCTEHTEQPKSFKKLGELIVEGKQFKNVRASTARVNDIFEQEGATSGLPLLIELCPQIETVLGHALVVRLGFQVGTVEKEMIE